MGFMLSIVSLGTVALQSSINVLGTQIIAAHTTARKLFGLLTMPFATVAAAIATFTSQNKGAEQYDRIRQGVYQANMLTTIYSIVVTILIFLSAPFLVHVMSGSSDPFILQTGSMYMRINSPFFIVLGVLLNLRNALQGMGRKIIPLFSSIIELVGKVIFASLLIPFMGYLGVCFCEPFVWSCMALQLWFSFYRSEEIRAVK